MEQHVCVSVCMCACIEIGILFLILITLILKFRIFYLDYIVAVKLYETKYFVGQSCHWSL